MMLINRFLENVVFCLAIASVSYSFRPSYKDRENNVLPDKKKVLDKFVSVNNLSTPEECARPCDGSDPKKCYYQFYVEQYSVLGRACNFSAPNRTHGGQCVIADGVERSAYTVNRMIPGPSIEVCEGDTAIIDVVNKLTSGALTIHWHGILQRNSQFYDGVPFVTQCPIQPGNTFRYIWRADDPGTHFWHSHTGLQKGQGIAGSIIIRQNNYKDPNSNKYEYDLREHVMFLQDWSHEYLDEKWPGRVHNNVGHVPASVLVNGKGKFQDPNTGIFTNASYEVFTVTAGGRYRFRLINAFSSTCPVQVTIDQHKMNVIATDGHPVKPKKVDSIVSASAERFDFILHANKQSGSYWIHLKALEECGHSKVDQVAILRYTTGPEEPQYTRPTYDYPLPTGKALNLPSNLNCDDPNAVCIDQLRSYALLDNEIVSDNVTKVYLPFRFDVRTPQELFKPNTYERYFVALGLIHAIGLIDNITNELPQSPLLTQHKDNSADFCHGDQVIQNCGLTCKCTHVIKIPYNSIVELILVDQVHAPGLHHPFHLHGFAFHVIGVRELPIPNNATLEEAVYLDKMNLLKRNYKDPPIKDTIMIPSNGYVVLRFRANNIGFWFLHCHILAHLITGMSAILQVGEFKDMPKPPNNFPNCSNFFPSV